ncbi:HAD family hydrolase [Enterococcus sp. AZ196]|uniref:HAD family hydrolase n=1 Tax=Enterococcus sp. AZ196 TaxID=2774659 RepID=UPI003D28695A
MKKLAFFDLDGTLCCGGGLQVEPEMIAAFSELRAKGILPVIATGRSYYEVKELLKQLRVEHFILSNGCYVRLAGKTLLDAKFSQTEIETILQIADQYQVSAGYFNQEGFAITNYSEIVEEHVTYMGIKEVPVEVDFYQNNPVNFMNLYVNAALEKEVKKELSTVADTVRFAPLAIDVLPKNVSKGAAIQIFLNSMAGTQMETYAFGDQNNDLSMFQLVDHGIAMHHGTEELKEQASYIAKTENGVLEGLRHYGLIS